MKTLTKITLTGVCTLILTLLSVFSKPLHLPDMVQLVLMVGLAGSLYLAYRFKLDWEREKKEGPAPSPSMEEQKIRRTKGTLILCMILGCLVGLAGPIWLPKTGTTLGTMGDFIIGLTTAVIVCLIFGTKIRQLGKESGSSGFTAGEESSGRKMPDLKIFSIVLMLVFVVCGGLSIFLRDRPNPIRAIKIEIGTAVKELEDSPPGVERAEKFLVRLKAIDTENASPGLKEALREYIDVLEQSLQASKSGQDTSAYDPKILQAQKNLLSYFR